MLRRARSLPVPMFGPLARLAPLALAAAAVAFGVSSVIGCGGSSPPANAPASSGVEVHSSGASIISLQISPDSLRVDKVGGRDGYIYPDGLLDLAFNVEVTGPISAFFLLSTDERGEPNGFFRTNTMVATEEAPKEFGGTLELGRMTPGLGVFENGKPINRDNGSINIGPGRHSLVFYTANPGSLSSGRHLRLYGVLADKSVIKGPILPIP